MSRRGFTLIELIMVVSIMALLIGMIGIMGNRWGARDSLRASARKLERLIRQCHQVALFEEVPVEIRFNTTPDTIEAWWGGSLHESSRLELGTTFERIRVGKIEGTRLAVHFDPCSIIPEIEIALKGEGHARLVLKSGAVANSIEFHETP